MTRVVGAAREADRLAVRAPGAGKLPRARLAGAPEETLAWYAFLAEYFPGRRRHDFEALSAYGAYKSSGGTARPEADAIEPRRPDLASRTPEDAWEDDGGAALANGRVLAVAP